MAQAMQGGGSDVFPSAPPPPTPRRSNLGVMEMGHDEGRLSGVPAQIPRSGGGGPTALVVRTCSPQDAGRLLSPGTAVSLLAAASVLGLHALLKSLEGCVPFGVTDPEMELASSCSS